MTSNAPQLSIAIPALNESSIIVGTISQIQEWMDNNLPHISYEIVIVNDGSTDAMPSILAKLCKTNTRLRVLHHPTNYGRGRAIRTAMAGTQSDFFIALDADLSYTPDHIGLLLTPLLNGVADLTLASPYCPGGYVENVPAFRAWLSRFGNKILAHSFQNHYYTSTCVVRGYTRKLIDHLELVSSAKDLHLEVIYKTELLGFSIVEVPSRLVWRDRKRGRTSKGLLDKIVNNSLIKMRKAIFSHVIFNFLAKPKLLFLGPIFILLGLSFAGATTLLIALIRNLLHATNESFFSIARTTLIQGELTLTLTISSLILLLVCTIFLFLASQAKKYFEESYILAARSNYRMKTILHTLEDKR
ncbi:MAG: glycosyltransferase family 2 protein [Alphaproteobacteria bacterium]|nr:glycosyltransferase family 2 protein [Alphaproteobacteria bacterium]